MKYLAIFIACIFGYNATARAVELRMRSAVIEPLPKVGNGVISYSINLAFDSIGGNVMSIFDDTLPVWHLRFFDARLKGNADSVTYYENSPFRKIEIVNFSSRYAMTGQVADVRITLDTWWTYEVVRSLPNVITVRFYRNPESLMAAVPVFIQRRLSPVMVILSSVAFVSALTVMFYLVKI